jgi:predicted dehydrogenase
MNRREFLQAAATVSASTFTARSYSQIVGANSKVGLGIVGVGRRGLIVGGAFLKDKRVRLTAIADTYDATRLRVAAQLPPEIGEPATYNAHQDLLAHKDVDAVLISAPDHLHVPIAHDALAAGKHVYLEKPTLHRWHERDTLVAAANKAQRVLQCGMQQRSGTHYQQVKEEYFDGAKLGDVVQVRAVWHDFPWQRREIPNMPKPTGLDWDRFLGTAPKVPYETVRYGSWRYFHEYGNGLLADILTHWADVAQWMQHDFTPISAYATGGIYKLHDQRNNPDTVSAIVKYAKWNLNFESSVLPLRNERPSVVFEGTEGLLDIARDGYIFTPYKGQPVRVDSRQDLELAHTGNFLDAITTGAKPNAPLEAGIQASVPVLLAVQSYWTKQSATSLEKNS